MSWAPERERLVRDGVCRRCGYENPSGSSWCGRCGAGWIDDEPRRPSRAAIAGPLNICPECGTVNGLDDRVCRGCRLRLADGRPAAQPPSRPPEPAPARHEDPPVTAVAAAPRRWVRGPVRTPIAWSALAGRLTDGLPVRGSALVGRLTEDWRRAATVGLLLVAAAAVLLTFVLSGSGPRRTAATAAAGPVHRTPAHAVPPKRSVVPSKRSVVPPVAARASAPHRPSPPPGPLSGVSAYWHRIAGHAFAAAYALLAPGALSLSESQFVAEERAAGIESVAFAGRTVSRSGSTASVAVDTLITHDLRYGCRSWSGFYVLRDSGGRWLIARAAITPRGC